MRNAALEKRLKIFWDGEYKVNVPSWEGGEVVMASDYDAALAALQSLYEVIPAGWGNDSALEAALKQAEKALKEAKS